VSLTLYDLNDRELLHRLNDVADSDGGATSTEISEALGLKGVEARNVSIRLSWMKRYGAVSSRDGERLNEEGKKVKTKLWFLTSAGERFVFAHMRKQQREALEALDDATLADVTEIVTTRYQVMAGSTTGQLIRRQWLSGTARWHRR
jgi:hypothetical protein